MLQRISSIISQNSCAHFVLLSRVSAAVLADGGDERFANRAFLKPEVSTYDAANF